VSTLLNLSTKRLLTWWCPTWPGWASLRYSPSPFGEWIYQQTRKRFKMDNRLVWIAFFPSHIPTFSFDEHFHLPVNHKSSQINASDKRILYVLFLYGLTHLELRKDF
jgi:hypothetical protein